MSLIDPDSGTLGPQLVALLGVVEQVQYGRSVSPGAGLENSWPPRTSRSLLHAAVEDARTLSASCSGHLLPRLLHQEGLFLQDNEPRQTFCLELFLVIDFYHRNQDINKATEGCISHFLNALYQENFG